MRQLHRRDGQFITCPPRSKAGTRTIALDEDTTAVLRTHAERHGEHGFVFTVPTASRSAPNASPA